MKYTFTFSCGHEGTEELFGPMKERERKVAYYEKHCICPECQRKAEGETVKKAKEEFGEIPLEGSEKQVEWAERILYAFLSEASRLSADDESTQAFKSAFITFLKGQRKASFWIDNRDKTLREILAENTKDVIRAMEQEGRTVGQHGENSK